MNYDEACKFFYKKTLKKQRVYRNKKLTCFLLFSDMILQANTFFIFRCLLNFTTYWRSNILEVTIYWRSN